MIFSKDTLSVNNVTGSLFSVIKMRKPILSSFLIFLLYRLSSVFLIQTSYVPDEYWQSLEVAHNMVFGYGYLTWEWKNGLRSYLYPSCFAFVYKILEFLNIDFLYLIILIPRLLQALLTAVSDQYFVLLCQNFGFDNYWAKVYILTNWFWYYCGCRTMTNTFETSVSVIALYYFPWDLFIRKTKGKKKSLEKTSSEIRYKSLKYMSLSALNCIVRPTAATIWGPLVIFHLISLPLKNLKLVFLSCILPVFACALLISTAVDFLWYRKIIIPAYNFLVFNVFKDISSFYGTHPFHWYLTQGLPVILGLHVLPFSLGCIALIRELYSRTNNSLKQVFVIWMLTLLFNILILSNIPHKEFRFALPLLPLMTLIAVKISSEFFKSSRTYKLVWTFLLALGFVVPSVLFGILHQRGSLQLMSYLSSVALKCTPNCLFLFLMPCHSTPLYSHLHVNVSTKFLTCDPPLTDSSYDESEDFFKNSVRWLESYWDDKKPPTHVALFDSIEDSIHSFLESKGFTKKHIFLHTVFSEKNSGKYIVVYES